MNKTHNNYRRLLIISVIFMILLPILNNVVLVLIYDNISGDIMYTTIAGIIDTTIDILIRFIMYFTLGLLINSLLREKIKGFPSKLICFFYIISLLIVYISEFVFAYDIYAYLFNLVILVFSDVIILAAVILSCKKTVRRYKITQPSQLPLQGKVISMKNPVLRVLLCITIVISACNFISCIIETVILIVQSGFPGNFGEVMYLAEPYLSLILYAAAGYLTMYLISLFWRKLTSTE